MIVIMSTDLISAFRNLSGTERRLAASAFLFHQGDRVASVFMVLDGAAELVRHQESGEAIVLQRAGTDTVLAEASVYSEHYHCSAIATADALMYAVPKRIVRAALRDDPAFAEAWMAYLAREVQTARFRSEMLSLPTIARRLDAWTTWHDDRLPERGRWRLLADEIAVTPEALYRELAKRRR